MTDCAIRVDEIEFSERPVRFRMPFRYGVVTLTEAPQAFVRVRVSDPRGRHATGSAADLLAPKWFDKSPDLTNEENFEQLRQALRLARTRYLETREWLSPFALHARHDEAHRQEAGTIGLNGLVAGFGSAAIDGAILDAACRLNGVSFFDAVRSDLMGLSAATAPDMEGFDFVSFLARLKPAEEIGCRHTVGLTDNLTEAEIDDDTRIGDGLPESLEAAIAAYGLWAFKVKICGDVEADIDRLKAIAAVLDRSAERYTSTLDGNEQFRSIDSFKAFYERLIEEPSLARFRDSIRSIEQPIARKEALSVDLKDLGEHIGFEIDESDSDISVFPAARLLGYRGISSKSCKGVYRSLINRARVEKWNAEDGSDRFFMSAEDLSTQAGTAVQQDLSLATLIGCADVEKNGHQYGDGMSGASEDERRSFHDKHPDLYALGETRLNLRINAGMISLRSLNTEGFGA